MIILNLNGTSINIYFKYIYIYYMASKYIDIAVIEPRKHPNLKIVVENIITNLKDVQIQIFHGNLNKNYILEELDKYLDKIYLTSLDRIIYSERI